MVAPFLSWDTEVQDFVAQRSQSASQKNLVGKKP